MTRSPALLLPAVLIHGACLALPRAPQDRVPRPAEHLGRPLGRDFELADWEEVSGYHRRLGETSPNVLVERLGSTQEGRDFLLTLISSPANLGRLEEIQGYNRILSDPRGRTPEELEEALERGRVTLFVSPGMHSTETSPPQFAMEFAHRLATSDEQPWRTAREELVVGIFPCTNPDGMDEVVKWYREHVGTPYEATGLDRLYQYYAGHDNNRDWFMLSLAETRLVTEQLYRRWRPQVYWDVHEQGSSRERFFVPPFRDPLSPNIDPAVIAGIDLLGTRALMDMTRDGFSGISTGVSYDMWWTGGNRNVPTRHNIIGLLTEAAGVRIATPLFLTHGDLRAPRGLGQYAPSNRFPNPWPGGWWRIRDVIDYELAFGRSIVGSLSREPRMWRANALELAQRAIARGRDEGPRAWLVPPSTNPDRAAVARLAEVLLATGVELRVAGADFEVDGRPWPAGTIVIRRDQPYGNHVKDLFEVQRYPDGDSPYDVAGWTLPLLLGVHRVEVMGEIGVSSVPADTVAVAIAAFEGDPTGDPQTISVRDGDGWRAVIAAMAEGRSFEWRTGSFRFAPADQGTGLPRIGLYSPWSGHMPEGWMRWVFDAWGLPYVTVRNEALRAGNLSGWLDVLVLPGPSARQLDTGRSPGSVESEKTRGLDPEGAVAIEEFVRTGGVLVAVGSSGGWAVELFGLPLVDVTRGEDGEGFSCPGSVLRTVPGSTPESTPDSTPESTEDPSWTAGLPPSVPVFFSRSSAWREMTEEELEDARLDGEAAFEVLLRYAPERVLLSGWISSPQTIQGRAAWVRAPYGQGSLHLFGFRPQYRSWSQGAFHLLFRALLVR